MLVLAATSLLPSSKARAGSGEDRLFSEANAAYAAGRYADARSRYEQILERGIQNERLLYNLGNAYLRLDQVGRAIWAYEKALRLSPGLNEASHNLQIAKDMANQKVRDKVVGAKNPGFWTRTLQRFSLPSATWWFLASWYLSFGLLFAVLWLRPGVLRSVGVAVTVLAFLACGLFGSIYQGRVNLAERTREAIVIEDRVEVREGPRGIATKAFEIHAGLKVEIAAREDRWLKIRLTNGLEGWVRADQMGEL
jgi:tetratricopeptide (TPR) repeat protein